MSRYIKHHNKATFTKGTFDLHSPAVFFRIKIIYTAAYKSVNAVQNVLMWRTSGVDGSHCVQFSTNTVLLA